MNWHCRKQLTSGLCLLLLAGTVNPCLANAGSVLEAQGSCDKDLLKSWEPSTTNNIKDDPENLSGTSTCKETSDVASKPEGTGNEGTLNWTGPDCPSENVQYPNNKLAERIELPIEATVSKSHVIDDISTSILKKELEFMRLNTNLRCHSTDRSRLKPWRIFAYNLGASGVAQAGIITVAAERWRAWQRPARHSRNTLQAGPVLLLTSHAIVTAGLLFEAGLDLIADRKKRKKGFVPSMTITRAKTLMSEIAELEAAREKAILSGELSESELSLRTLEGRFLQDTKMQLAADYTQAHTRAVRRRVVRDVLLANGLAASTTGGYMGSLCGLLAVAERKPRLAGPAGIGFTLSGAHIAIAPVLGRVTGNIVAKRTAKRVKKEIPFQTGSDPSVVLADLERSAKPVSSPQFEQRLAAYRALNGMLKEQGNMNAKEKAKTDKEFKERLLVNAIVGGTKMGWGIQLMNAGFGFTPRPATPTRTVRVGGTTVRVPLYRPLQSSASLFSHRVAQGATTYIPGTSTWILDTLQARARSELDVYSAGAQYQLPHQKLDTRIEKLEALEANLR